MYYTTARAVPTEYSPPMNIKLHLVVPSYYFFNLVCQFLEKKKKQQQDGLKLIIILMSTHINS